MGTNVSEKYSKGKGKKIPVQPWKGPRFPVVWGSKISRQSAYECGKDVSPMHRPPLPPPKIFLVLISVRSWVNPRAIVRTEGLCQSKIPVTPSGIEPTTLRLVTHCATGCSFGKIFPSTILAPTYNIIPKEYELTALRILEFTVAVRSTYSLALKFWFFK